MIVITGNFVARPESLTELTALSLEHVRRSRTEPGCISHNVYANTEDPLRLFFYEEWETREAIATHFAVPASRAFVAKARELAAEVSAISVNEVTPVRI